MVKNRWLLGCVLLSLCLLFLYQHSMKLLVLLAVLFIFVILDILVFLLQKKQGDLQVSLKHNLGNTDKMSIGLTYNKLKPFISSKVVVTLVVRNQWTSEKQEVILGFYPFISKSVTLKGQLSSPHKGLLIVEVLRVRQFDFLSLMSRDVDVKSSEVKQVLLPDVFDISLMKNVGGLALDVSDDIINVKTTDNGEVFDFKEYDMGDSIKQIHWKLSVKENQLIVKELSEVAESMRIVLLESHYVKKREKAKPRELDALLSSYASLVSGFLDQYIPVMIAWYSVELEQIKIDTISSQEELYKLYQSIEDISYEHDSSQVLDKITDSLLATEVNELFYLTANKGDVIRPLVYEGKFTPVIVSRRSKSVTDDEVFLSSKNIEKDLMEVVF